MAISKDFAAGLTFIVLGLIGVVVASGHEMGTARAMGPGYFPWLLSVGLTLFGVIIFIQGIASKSREPIENMHWRPVFMVTLAIALFGILIESTGLVIALLLLIAIGAYGGPEARWREVLPLAIGLLIFCAAVFVYGVKLPISLLPGLR